MISREFVQRERRLNRKIHEIVPQIYASFCLALHRRYNFGFRRIVTVLIDTQEYWQKSVAENIDIIKLCEEETGINVLSEQTAKETGAKGQKI